MSFPPLQAQDAPVTAPAPTEYKTTISLEVLTTANFGLRAQEWARAFDQLGMAVTVRAAREKEIPKISQTITGRNRVVSLVGVIDGEGRLVFPAKRFQLGDSTAIEEWFKELKTYGAQGAPAGGAWGLNAAQFEQVFAALAEPLEHDLRNMTVPQAVEKLNWPEPIEIEVAASAVAHLATLPEPAVIRQSPATLSRGTGLAVALNDLGLVLRPVRKANGSLSMSIAAEELLSKSWPLGWEPPADVVRTKLAPDLYKMKLTVGYEATPLAQVLSEAETGSAVPMIVDYRKCAEKGVDLEEFQVKSPVKQNTAWALVVSSAVHQARLTLSLKVDEVGRPFMFVAPFTPK